MNNIKDYITKTYSNTNIIIINKSYNLTFNNKTINNIIDEESLVKLSGLFYLMSIGSSSDSTNASFIRFKIFEIISSSLFLAMLVNLTVIYKDTNTNTNNSNTNNLLIENTPFKNIAYLFSSFFLPFLKPNNTINTNANNNSLYNLNSINSPYFPFPEEHYNYYNTKDNKKISVGNLESKFQDNLYNDFYSKILSSSEDLTRDSIKRIYSKYNMKEIISKAENINNCIAPVLSLEEAIDFHKEYFKF